MIERFMILIIQELGPAGLLIVGLYFILGKHLKKICNHIAVINDEIGKIQEVIKACTDRICDEINRRDVGGYG